MDDDDDDDDLHSLISNAPRLTIPNRQFFMAPSSFVRFFYHVYFENSLSRIINCTIILRAEFLYE